MIADSLKKIREALPSDGSIDLIAVSKFQPNSCILEAYDAGQRKFGESRVQELKQKASLPCDIEWHFIGHLQTNKVRDLLKIKNLSLIESVDSFRLLDVIESECEKFDRNISILFEVLVAKETTKTGINTENLIEWFENKEYRNYTHVCFKGIMGMASNTEDEERIRNDFREIKTCFDKIRSLAPDLRDFNVLSMGMSGDYQIAVEEGSTSVRIGSSIFGNRER